MAKITKVGSGAFAGAAALALSVAAIADAQQAPPTAATAQPAPLEVGAGLGLEPTSEGPKVVFLPKGGTGAALGVRVGDIVLKYGEISVTGPQSWREYAQGMKVGDPVSITVRRDGRTIKLKGKGLAPPPTPPNRSTPVEVGELRETWNNRSAQGTPGSATQEVNGWAMGVSMPLARAENALVELDGRIWALGGWAPGRMTSNLVQVFDPATGFWTLGP
ncbi:MAG TPA: hypothetical protein VM899_10385, partial [Rubellimicrobium sp.]|nr:hypothetical protein [Rubellimicrobium sp.]